MVSRLKWVPADCIGLTQVAKYQGRTNNARTAAFSVSQRGFSLGGGLQGKVVRTPHQSKGSGGMVCAQPPCIRVYVQECGHIIEALVWV